MDYKFIFLPALDFCGESSFEKEFETHEEAINGFNLIANYTLMLHECSLMPDYSNCGSVYKRDTAVGWVEIDDDGFEI